MKVARVSADHQSVFADESPLSLGASGKIVMDEMACAPGTRAGKGAVQIPSPSSATGSPGPAWTPTTSRQPEDAFREPSPANCSIIEGARAVLEGQPFV